jgi:insecticidal toxin complex protein TccC
MNLHSHTPALLVTDARGSAVRHVRFCRTVDQSAAEPRLVRQVFDLAGRLVSVFDARLDLPHTSTIQALSGAALLTDSADAGWRVNLSGEAGQVLETWDSRGSRSFLSHDALLRPVAVIEQLDGQAARTVERLTYGEASNESAAHNQCGQLLRRDDPAGSTAFLAFGLTRACLLQQRRFLLKLDQPDWPEALSERDALLEAEGHVSSSVVSALGEVINSTDAQGHRQLREYGCDGQLKHVNVKLANAESTQRLVRDIRYNALGAVTQETAGNGAISTAFYDEGDGRLLRLLAQSTERTFQDLNYTYDPVGNVVSVEDAAQSTDHFNQQRTDPVNLYRYDSLYQLIEATGREVAAFGHGPHLPSFQTLPVDAGCLVNYTQRFDYDAGGNLIARHHSGTDTWRMATSTTSNRSVPQRADGLPAGDEQINAGFDGNGNLIGLQPGQVMGWDARNQLSDITSVIRDEGPNDGELYRYDGDGRRVRKVRYAQTRSRTLTVDVRYLPGLEIHRNDASAEVRHVLTVEAGRCTVRVLHWETGKPDDVANDQLRYNLSDHLGSSTLELDAAANLISHEGYYPYGGTAWWVGSSAVEATYKVVRYSGKERDGTGLYYYGLRYYAPWLQRWVSPDPAGNVDGLNLYRMVADNPISCSDFQGLITIPADIFVSDIMGIEARSISTGWFEELQWDAGSRQFHSKDEVYGRGMTVYKEERPRWELSEDGSAIAFFRDAEQRLRLFTNTYQQHMGIQPAMGLPLAAGVLRMEDGQLIADNHSGHYKPPASIDVQALFEEFAPGSTVQYRPISEPRDFSSIPRLSGLQSPEDYADAIERFKIADKQPLISFLKDQRVWAPLTQASTLTFGLQVLKRIDSTGEGHAEAANALTRQDMLSASQPPAVRAVRRPIARPATPAAMPSNVSRSAWRRAWSSLSGKASSFLNRR